MGMRARCIPLYLKYMCMFAKHIYIYIYNAYIICISLRMGPCERHFGHYVKMHILSEILVCVSGKVVNLLHTFKAFISKSRTFPKCLKRLLCYDRQLLVLASAKQASKKKQLDNIVVRPPVFISPLRRPKSQQTHARPHTQQKHI